MRKIIILVSVIITGTTLAKDKPWDTYHLWPEYWYEGKLLTGKTYDEVWNHVRDEGLEGLDNSAEAKKQREQKLIYAEDYDEGYLILKIPPAPGSYSRFDLRGWFICTVEDPEHGEALLIHMRDYTARDSPYNPPDVVADAEGDLVLWRLERVSFSEQTKEYFGGNK